MLYRKTTTAFSAVILGVMALLGATAHAQINLDGTPCYVGRCAPTQDATNNITVFSKESLPRPGARQTHYFVQVPSESQNELVLRAQLGLEVLGGTGRPSDGAGGVAVRYDLENLQFGALASTFLGIWENNNGAPGSAPTGAVFRLALGGTGTPGSNARCNGQTCAIFEVGSTVGNDLPGDSFIDLILWSPGRVSVHPDGQGRVRMRLFNNIDSALNPGSINDEVGLYVGGLRKDTGSKLAIDVQSSITTRLVPGAAVIADVAAMPRFTNFMPAGRNALGAITIGLNTTHWTAAGTQVGALGDVMSTQDSGIVFADSTQNLGFGTLSMRGACNDAAPLAGVSVPASGANAGRGVTGIFAGTRTLCIEPKRPGTARTGPFQEIPVTAVTASVTYAPILNGAYAAAAATGPIGSIVRNGATVQLSYLTTSDRYNQRIIITNRSAADAEYELTNFYTEDGTEANGGEGAMGTVPAMSSVVVLTRDAIQFTGTRNRGSATLAVTAPARTISVSTAQVNNSDGSTDTVDYEVMGAGS